MSNQENTSAEATALSSHEEPSSPPFYALERYPVRNADNSPEVKIPKGLHRNTSELIDHLEYTYNASMGAITPLELDFLKQGIRFWADSLHSDEAHDNYHRLRLQSVVAEAFVNNLDEDTSKRMQIALMRATGNQSITEKEAFKLYIQAYFTAYYFDGRKGPQFVKAIMLSYNSGTKSGVEVVEESIEDDRELGAVQAKLFVPGFLTTFDKGVKNIANQGHGKGKGVEHVKDGLALRCIRLYWERFSNIPRHKAKEGLPMMSGADTWGRGNAMSGW